LAPTREKGQRLIMAGQVRIGDVVFDKPGRRVPTNVAITIDAGLPYVSRGGLKLEAALDRFDLEVEGWTAADVGASTGGFTDCLLQRGVARVYAIDVGYGQLAWSLRQNPRVVVMERTNARYLERLPELIDLVTIDASFISLKLLLPPAVAWLGPDGRFVVLIKPQFEAGRSQVGKRGVVRDPAVHRQVLLDILGWAERKGWGLQGLIPSPILGPAGNVEFLAYIVPGAGSTVELETLVEGGVERAAQLQNA
jgi:23S rRNA (cytidine1920-2'-O)/16S rRNA (cytidine1409-2'-O)-methyltransferase